MISVQKRPECWPSLGSLSCSLWKSVYHDWTDTDATYNCMPACESILTVTAGWFISVCGFCLCGIRRWKSHVWWFLGMKELLNLLHGCCVGRAGPIPWPGRSCEFTLLCIVFIDYVTEHIYIPPFGILLMERHAEIEHVLRHPLFWDCTQHEVVIPFQCLGKPVSAIFKGQDVQEERVLIAHSLHLLHIF
jgi:hypothetical protein